MNRPNSLDTIRPFSGQYSFKTDLKVNAWFFVAVAVSMTSRFLLDHHLDGPAWARATVALSPLVPSLLWVRRLIQFIRGMDEMQKRIQFEAWLIACLGSLFVGTAINMLNANGVRLPIFKHGLEFGDAVLLTFAFWIIGHAVTSRRYA